MPDPNEAILRTFDLAEQNRMLQIANDALATEVVAGRDRMAAIQSLADELRHIQDLDVLAARVLEECVRVTRAEAAGLIRRDGDRLVLEESHTTQGADGQEPHAEHPTFRMGDAGVVAEAVRTGSVAQLQTRDACCAIEPELRQALGIDASVALALPLASPDVAFGEVRGVILILDGRPRAGFLEEEVGTAQHIATVATLAFERTRLIRTMILRMVAMTEIRDPHETGAHVRRVAGYSVAILDAWGRRNGIDAGELARMRDRLYIAALLHDVGKVGIPDAILTKPGRLTDGERRVMERHTTIGAGLFRGLRTDFDDAAREVALFHHARWDGTGYPIVDAEPTRSGEANPFFARIVALADVFDALSSARVYKDAWPQERVVDHVHAESGRHFDPELVICLDEALPAMRRIGRRFVEPRREERGREASPPIAPSTG